MKTLRMFAVFALVSLCLFASAAQAGDISVLFGTEMTTSKQVKMNTPFSISIVVSNINDNMGAVEYKLNLPANVAVIGSSFYNDTPTVLDGPDGTAIALGECVSMFGGGVTPSSVTVAELTAIAVDTFTQTQVSMSPYAPDSGQSSAPRYANCQDQIVELIPATGTLEGVSVPNNATSFGKVKSLF